MVSVNRLLAVLMSIVTLFTGMFTVRDKSPQADTATAIKYNSFSGVVGDSVELKSEQPVEVNNMILREKSSSITGFTLEALIGDNYVFVTSGDTVEDYRFCSFNSVKSDSFKLTVTACKKEGFSLNSVELGKTDIKNSDFKVVSYFIADGISDSYTPDEGWFLTTTDLIVFGAAVFDENGDITLKNTENISSALNKIKQINPDIKIHINFLGPSASDPDWNTEMNKKAKLHLQAMQKNKNKFIDNIIDVLNTYNYDGLFFDWEYPITIFQQLAFSSFLVSLDAAIGDKELGAAMSSWCCYLTPLARSVLDNVEIMCYDLFDDYGYHASFSSAYDSVNEFLKKGYKKEQLHLGLAFYARPTDGGAYWFCYCDNYQSLGYYNNVCTVTDNGKEYLSYFNSAQMIRDKTQYALSTGLSGVMIWNLACDVQYSNELSLYRAINDTINH